MNTHLRLGLAALAGLLMPALFHSAVTAQTWKQTGAPAANWLSLACSADVRVLYAVSAPYGGQIQHIYRSVDSGGIWEPTPAPSREWASVSCSADGTRVVALGNGVFVSEDSGDSWNLTDCPGGTACASSADGTTLLVVGSIWPDSGVIYVSTNAGTSWTQAGSPSANGPWNAAASSADGLTLLAAGSFTFYHGVYGKVAVSTNSGATWWMPELPDCMGWNCAAASADGRTLVVAGSAACEWSPWIYVSTNRGVTWMPSGPLTRWGSVTCSADGTSLAAAESGWGVGIFASTDAGVTWASADAALTNWGRIVYSADGTKLIAAAGGQTAPMGLVYALEKSPAPILGIRCSGPNVTVSWLTPSMPFIVQQTASLSQARWTQVDVQPTLNYTNLNQEVSLPEPNGPMFYRLVSR